MSWAVAQAHTLACLYGEKSPRTMDTLAGPTGPGAQGLEQGAGAYPFPQLCSA